MLPTKYIFMYNGDEADEMFKYIKEFFGDHVIIQNVTYFNGKIHNFGQSLWVSEEMYKYVFAAINAHNLYHDELDDELDVVTKQDCEEWKNNSIKNGMYFEL